MIRIWLIDDQRSSYELLREALPTEELALSYYGTVEELRMATTHLNTHPHLTPHIVFVDYYLDHPYTGSQVLRYLERHLPQVKTIAFSSAPNRNQQLLEEGATMAIAKSPAEEAAKSIQRLFPNTTAVAAFCSHS